VPGTVGGVSQASRSFVAGSAAIVVLAFCLRLYQLSAQELWLDEAAAWYWATAPDWLAQTVVNNTPPLHSLLLRGWSAVAGESQTALRLPSVLLGTGFVAAVLWAGCELFTPEVALWGALWAAVAPLHIYYSQEVRAYALLMLALLLTAAAAWRAARRDTTVAWALVSLCATLALYSHYLAGVGVLATVAVLRLGRRPAPVRHYAIALLVSVALFVPWVVASFLMSPHSLQGTEWIRGMWEKIPPALAIPRSLEVFGLGSQAGLLPLDVKQFGMEFPTPLRYAGLAVLLGLGVWVVLPWGEAALRIADIGARKRALGVLLFGPLLVLWCASFWHPVYIPGRYDLVAFPAFPLWLGLALYKLQCQPRGGRWAAALVALALAVPIGAKLMWYYHPPVRSELHPTAVATAHALDARVADGDVVIFTDLRALPVLYQLNQVGVRWHDQYCESSDGRRFGCRMFPRETEATPAVYDPQRVLRDPGAVREDVRDILWMRRPGGSVHVVFGNYAVAHERLAVAPVESLLVTELQRLGFQPVATDLKLGTMQYRRVTPSP